MLLLTTLALGWESECQRAFLREHAEETQPGYERYHASICAPLAFCEEDGLEPARGVQWGEHSLITRMGMDRAGLAPYLDARAVPPYFGIGGTIAEYERLEPAAPGNAQVRIERGVTLPELAHLPDWSYALSDYVLGNEHCFLANTGDRLDLATCHSFKMRMGPVNSTHFAPQNRSAYAHHHAIALSIAGECVRLADAADDVDAGASRYLRDVAVPACEKEALAYEAVASHYLADMFSSGHMWERWGQPTFPSEDADKARAMVLGPWSGLYHGWRAVAATTLGYGNDAPIHDRLCLGGPIPDIDDELLVEWGYPGEDARHAGVGDDYLLACKALPSQDPPWVLMDHPELAFQKERMLDCIAAGFAEVYAAGPRLSGDIAHHGAIASSLDAMCWDHRVTNLSMFLGAGVSMWPASRSTRVGSRLMLGELLGSPVAGTLIVDVAEFQGTLRDDLRRAAVVQFQTLDDLSLRDPQGLDAATLEHPDLRDLLGFQRNSAYTSLIDDGRVEYLEGRDPRAWLGTGAMPCNTDLDCPSSAFCAASGSERRCYHHESAVLEAFRVSHVRRWCQLDDQDAVLRARSACDAGQGDSAACGACVDVALPKLRPTGGRSVCEALGVPGAVTFDVEATAVNPSVAQRWCEGPPQGFLEEDAARVVADPEHAARGEYYLKSEHGLFAIGRSGGAYETVRLDEERVVGRPSNALRACGTVPGDSDPVCFSIVRFGSEEEATAFLEATTTRGRSASEHWRRQALDPWVYSDDSVSTPDDVFLFMHMEGARPGRETWYHESFGQFVRYRERFVIGVIRTTVNGVAANGSRPGTRERIIRAAKQLVDEKFPLPE